MLTLSANGSGQILEIMKDGFFGGMTHQTFQSRLQGTQSAIQEEANDSDEEPVM